MSRWNSTGVRMYNGSEIQYHTIAEGVEFTPEQAQDLVNEFHAEQMNHHPPRGHWELQVCTYNEGTGWTSGEFSDTRDGPPELKDMSHGSDGEAPFIQVKIKSVVIYRVNVR